MSYHDYDDCWDDDCEECYEEGYEEGWHSARKSYSSGGGNKAPQSSDGCYVATCVYGSYDCPEVWTLRRYRDLSLASTRPGRAFIHTYYAISPQLVKWFGHVDWIKKVWKSLLDRKVTNLHGKGVDDSPYEDQNWRR